MTGGSRRVITGSTHSTGGGVVGVGTRSSSTRVVSGGSGVVTGGSTGGSRVVNGGSAVVSGGGSSSRVIERRIVSTGGEGSHSVVRGGSTSVIVSKFFIILSP